MPYPFSNSYPCDKNIMNPKNILKIILIVVLSSFIRFEYGTGFTGFSGLPIPYYTWSDSMPPVPVGINYFYMFLDYLIVIIFAIFMFRKSIFNSSKN